MIVEIDGKKIAETYKKNLRRQVENLKEKKVQPTIAPVLIGDDPGARLYYRTKRKLAEKLGIEYRGIELGEETSEETLVKKIRGLNRDPSVHGLFIELPLPEGLEFERLREKITPKKDIDCITPVNSGKLLSGGARKASYEDLKNDPEIFLPATPYAVMEILKYLEVDLAGKELLVIGGGAVGLPLSILALREGYATITLCEYRTSDLAEKTRRADIICSSVGKRNFITSDMVSEGSIVIDIGINKTENGVTGDVDYESVKGKASYITPVPGGVGPMTTTLIMSNTVQAARLSGDCRE